ncbi:HNH endonuclease [Nocardia australiensis]|uniref:HNH endonuclease n=1 Tax=Nocardia australiensis TaxID=2887191 RepID=UPI001D14CD21|nr:HNH endonuclease [Nocardia australiensis]
MFLESHGFKSAREYFLLYEGRAYDSKAIVGVAYSLMTGEQYTAKDFSGGLALTERLERLGFEVTGKMDWKLEEQVLACDLLDQNGWRTIPERDSRTEDLSKLLRAQWVYAPSIPEYRGTDSVHRKFEDLRTAHPDHEGARTRGGKLSVHVAASFAKDPHKMRALAETLRQNGQLDLVLDLDEEYTDTSATEAASAEEIVAAIEGKASQRLTRVYERDPKLRRRKIEQSRKERNSIACEVCGFDFEATYPGVGDGYVHVHHVVPLHTTGPVENTLDDLILLCANCHQMIHRPKQWLTPDELRAIFNL